MANYGPKPRDPRDRLMEKVVIDFSDPDACWLFTGSTTPSGYGYIRMTDPRRMEPVHRVMHFFVHGVWPDGDVDHTCATRNCVRPSHLEDVSHQENQQRAAKPEWILNIRRERVAA